jgi:hypothetical protein
VLGCASAGRAQRDRLDSLVSQIGQYVAAPAHRSIDAWQRAGFDKRIATVTRHASNRVLFDELAGVRAADLPRELVQRLRPQVYAAVRGATRAQYWKIHDAWREVAPQLPLIPSAVTRGVVYVVRNPLDVAVSLRSHLSIIQDPSKRMHCHERDRRRVAHAELGGWRAAASNAADIHAVALALAHGLAVGHFIRSLDPDPKLLPPIAETQARHALRPQ